MWQSLAYIFGGVLLFIGWGIFERYKWQKLKDEGAVVCEIHLKNGNTVFKVGKRGKVVPEGQEVIVKSSSSPNIFKGILSKSDIKINERTYYMNEDCKRNIDMPSNSLLGPLVRVTMPLVHYDEGNSHPVIYRGQHGIPSGITSNLRNDQTTEIMARESLEDKKRDDMLRKVINPMTVYVMLGVTVLVAGIAMYFAYKTNTDMTDMQKTMVNQLNAIKTGMGIQ